MYSRGTFISYLEKYFCRHDKIYWVVRKNEPRCDKLVLPIIARNEQEKIRKKTVAKYRKQNKPSLNNLQGLAKKKVILLWLIFNVVQLYTDTKVHGIIT